MKFHIQDDTLTITLEGGERFWALKRRLIITKTKIERVAWQQQFIIPRRKLGWRIGGTAMPGGLFAGTFVSGSGGRNFLYLQHTQSLFNDVRAQHVLTVELRGYSYRRLFLTVDSPELAGQIIAWWSGNV